MQLDTDTVQSVARKHGVTYVAVFGSFARATADANSDLDLLVAFDRPRSLFVLSQLRAELEDSLHREVDVLTHGALDPDLRERVEHELQVLYDDRS
jgi:uncharacterized protein